MSIAEKLQTIAENVPKVYEAGKQASGGGNSEAFWYTYQDNGNRRNYDYAFAGGGWTDALYNPKYPIIADNNHRLFTGNDKITDTKVPIVLNGKTNPNESANIFFSCTSLKTIPSLTIGKETDLIYMFEECYALEHIGLEGEAWGDLIIQSSENLNDETLMNLVNVAKDFLNDENESVQELAYSFGIYLVSDLSNKLFEMETDERFPEQYQGMSLFDVLDMKGWVC